MISPVHEELCVDIYFLSDVIEFLALAMRYDLYSLFIFDQSAPEGNPDLLRADTIC